MFKTIRLISLLRSIKKDGSNASYDSLYRFMQYRSKNKSYIKESKIYNKYLLKFYKFVRAHHAYIPIDFSKSRDLYNAYHNIPGAIPSYEELMERVKQRPVYIVKFRDEAPIKGTRYCEYYTNIYGGRSGTFKLTGIVEHRQHIGLHSMSPKGRKDLTINESFLRCFRYATENEIKEFDKKEAKAFKIQMEIDKLNKQVIELSRKLNKI